MRFLGAIVCILLAGAAAAAGNKSSAPNRYGAIAYHQASGAWGVSQGAARERDASAEALRQCGDKQCVVVHKFKNGCAALARSDKKHSAASGATRDEAETKALARCGAGCQALAWSCTK